MNWRCRTRNCAGPRQISRRAGTGLPISMTLRPWGILPWTGGLILEVNLTGARLLGTPRDLLLRKPFILFVAPGHRRAFQAHLRYLPAGGALQFCELELIPQRGPVGAVSLESLAIVGAGATFSSIARPSPISPGAEPRRMTCAAVKKSFACFMKKPLWAINPWTKTALSGRSTRPGWTSWDTPSRR